MRKFIIAIVAVFCALQVQAQGPGKFNPKKFEAEMQQFITVEAGLTPMEAAKFFPLFNELHSKQRLLFEKMNQYRHTDTSDNKASLQAIKKMDEIDIQMKKLQQQYHLKFCKILPPGKVLQIIQADEKFHRQIFKKIAHRNK